jgi:hypothetical protein
VTAANGTGSTSATLQITVNVAAPSNLVYPQTTITAIVGQGITPDTPTVTGTVTSFVVSPELPAGLSLNSSTGTISGTPTIVAAQAAYMVTAANSGGSTTSSITIIVIQPQNILLELGHVHSIEALQYEGNRVLSADASGHWVLWDYASGALLANGDVIQMDPDYPVVKPIKMAGQTVVIGIPNGLEIRAASDGHLISTIDYPGLNLIAYSGSLWWQLASDGSYICIGSKTRLFVFAPTGQTAVWREGDYSLAKSFAAPGEILVALGPAGQNVVETISTADGTSFLSPTFSGQFNSWFVDGGRFLTNLSNTVWVYSDTGVQQAIVTLPTIENLTGQGNWIWTYYRWAVENNLNIYPIGNMTPALSYGWDHSTAPIASGTTIGIIPHGTGQVSVIDLSGSNPSMADYAGPILSLSAYAASSSSQWVAGNDQGALLDGASLSDEPRYFGHGKAWSIAGTSGLVAISTAIGEILLFDPYSKTLEGTISFSSGKLALSSDGNVLGASADANDYQYKPDRTLNFYSLPSGAVISSFPYVYETGYAYLIDFTLAASGATIGQVTRVLGSTEPIIRQVTSTAGGSVIWSDTHASLSSLVNTILLSPDGTMIGAHTGTPNPPLTPVIPDPVTNIIKNGTLVTAVPGSGIGWIDNDRILVNQYRQVYRPVAETVYVNAAIFSSAGVQLDTLPLPMLKSIQTVTSDSVYAPNSNAIYSLTTGEPVWTGSFLSSGMGAVAGSYVVYLSGHSVLVEAF